MMFRYRDHLQSIWRMRRKTVMYNILLSFIVLLVLYLYIWTTKRRGKVVVHDFSPVTVPKTRNQTVWKLKENEPKKHGVIMVTGLTYERLDSFKDIEDFYQKVWENREQYAEAHGYHNMMVDLGKYTQFEGRHPVWRKLGAIMEAFEIYPEAEWVWWLDIDAIIMTPTVDLYAYLLAPDVLRARLVYEQLIVNTKWRTGENLDPSKIDIICSQDDNGLNVGSFFIRNNDLMHLLLDFWSDPVLAEYADEEYVYREESLLVHLIDGHPYLRERIGWVPLSHINAYGWGFEHERWHPGQLTIHFPNCTRAESCGGYFNTYWAQRQVLEGMEIVHKHPPPLSKEFSPTEENKAQELSPAVGSENV